MIQSNNNERKNDKNADSKLELANKIAHQSKKVAKTYARFEDLLFRVIRNLSAWIDRILFNSKFTLLVSLVLAIFLYFTINFNAQNSLFGTPLVNAKGLSNVSVVARYNSDVFEVAGLPTTANITIMGEGSNVNAAASQKGIVVANLEGLTEGTHQVKLAVEGFNDNVDIKIEPSVAVVNLKKKSTGQFDIGYDFINQSKMNSIYSLGVPEFEYSKVNVRASKDTLDSIAFIKALIDVTGVESDFQQEAILAAYDKKGMPVNAEIIPNTINVKVGVTSPNKVVPIKVEVTGEVPGGMAIETIIMDHETVTIYASDSVLSKIDSVVVTVDATTLTKDTTVSRAITLPAGVKEATINQVTMEVTLGEGVVRTVENVPIFVKNNINKYTLAPLNDQTSVNVEVFGTQSNVDKVNGDNISVYFDMSAAVLGDQEFSLMVEQPFGSFVKYSIPQPTILVNVSGSTEESGE